MSTTDNLKLNISIYGETSGADWTANHEANWILIDQMVTNILVYEGDILTYEDELLISAL